jgi:hypothetical protein
MENKLCNITEVLQKISENSVLKNELSFNIALIHKINVKEPLDLNNLMSIYKDGMRSTVGARHLFYNILLCITKNEINSNFYPVEYTALTLINGYFLEIVKYDKELLNIV